MENLVQVRLRDMGPVLCFRSPDVAPKNGDLVIVEVERGLDYGQVVSDPVAVEHPDDSVKKVVRPAQGTDLKQIDDNRKKAHEASSTCAQKIHDHKLEMKLVGSEYAFDRSKI